MSLCSQKTSKVFCKYGICYWGPSSAELNRDTANCLPYCAVSCYTFNDDVCYFTVCCCPWAGGFVDINVAAKQAYSIYKKYNDVRVLKYFIRDYYQENTKKCIDALFNQIAQSNYDDKNLINNRWMESIAELVVDASYDLHDAKNPFTVVFLIARGNDVNKKKPTKIVLQATEKTLDLTPLHKAIAFDHSDKLIEMLLDAGADVDIESDFGLTPREFAKIKDRNNLIALFEETTRHRYAIIVSLLGGIPADLVLIINAYLSRVKVEKTKDEKKG